MNDEARMSKMAVGFLTVVEHPQLGLFGGYLILNAAARPLEFHCTAPVKPNRAQEILYGRTLRPYLYGELIGQTLLEKAKLRPRLVCTDHADVLAVRSHTDLPLACVVPVADGSAVRVPGGTISLAVDDDQRGELIYLLEHEAVYDLLEPFERIREAIQEAQRAPAASGGQSRAA